MPMIKRLIGGAGTGKTTAQMTDMNRAREELGLSPEEIGATTFTRNGRAVMAAKAAEEWGCSVESLTKHGNWRTTHSIAMRQLEVTCDQMLSGDAESMSWVSGAIGTEIVGNVDVDDEDDAEPLTMGRTTESKEAAFAIHAWNYARSTLTPLADVIEKTAACGQQVLAYEFAASIIEKYETAKHIYDRLDFHDLLCRFAGIAVSVDGFRQTIPKGDPPEGVRAWFIDEAQDASALVDRTCRRLAEAPQVERCLLSGDNFQAIFGFGGSDYRHFMAWEAEQQIMPRSFRCPAEVMALGERCLMEMHEGYFDRQIAPADHDGSVETTGTPEDAIEMLDMSGTTLILARCNYSLRKYEKQLTAKGLPWRHLKIDYSETLKGFQTLWLLERGEVIEHDQWCAAIAVLQASDHELGPLLIPGEKEAWREGLRSRWDLFRPQELEQVGCTTALAQAVRAGQWAGLVLPKYRNLASRWIASAHAYGPELATYPKISLATIHAAKGAEGDTVILSTETSKRIELSRRLSAERHDEECRIAYVGVTRARKQLIVVQDSARFRMRLPL